MPSGVRLSLVVWLMALGVSACDFPRNSPTVNDSPATTTEVLRFADSTAPTPKSVSVYVEHGDVSVVVVESVDANHVVVVAPALGINEDLTTDVVFANVGEHELITVTHKEASNPLAPTHIYVQPNVPIDIRADHGDIHIAGNVGKVSAEAKNGSIDVRGPAPGLNLKVGGGAHGIVVDGAHGQLDLYAQAGPINVVAERVTITATTGGDAAFRNSGIVFVGSLITGTDGVFSTTSASDITLVMPRNDAFDIKAQTTGQSTIDVQYPGPEDQEGVPVPVCGTFNQGEPYISHVDDRDHKTRAQIVFNRGGQPFTETLSLDARLSPNGLAFHSSVRTYYALLPKVDRLFIETCGGTSPPAQDVAASSGTTLSAEDQKQLDTFTGGVKTEVSVQVAAPPPAMATCANFMHPVNCPFDWTKEPRYHLVRVTSNGGQIRIYQNLPRPQIK